MRLDAYRGPGQKLVKGRWKFMKSLLIGKQDNPMMKRLRLIQTPKFGVYVHFIYREDMDADVHDHPWEFWRIVLKGGYEEVLTFNPSYIEPLPIRRVPPWKKVPRYRHKDHRPSRAPKLFDHFKTTWAHRITSVDPGTVTLVIVGPKFREWGFWVEQFGSTPGARKYSWIAWTEYLKEATPGREAASTYKKIKGEV